MTMMVRMRVRLQQFWTCTLNANITLKEEDSVCVVTIITNLSFKFFWSQGFKPSVDCSEWNMSLILILTFWLFFCPTFSFFVSFDFEFHFIFEFEREFDWIDTFTSKNVIFPKSWFDRVDFFGLPSICAWNDQLLTSAADDQRMGLNHWMLELVWKVISDHCRLLRTLLQGHVFGLMCDFFVFHRLCPELVWHWLKLFRVCMYTQLAQLPGRSSRQIRLADDLLGLFCV